MTHYVRGSFDVSEGSGDLEKVTGVIYGKGADDPGPSLRILVSTWGRALYVRGFRLEDGHEKTAPLSAGLPMSKAERRCCWVWIAMIVSLTECTDAGDGVAGN